MERHTKVLTLKAQIKVKEAEILLNEQEKKNLENELFDNEWLEFTWEQLEKWLKENRPNYKYTLCPVVCNGKQWQSKDYCFINKDGNLQIGAYESNDRFPKSKNIFVAYDFRNWGG